MNSNLPDRIYLAGFMGSGKSTIAPMLARRISYGMIDLDEAVEARAGKSIPDIFEQNGEGKFRRLERQMLEQTGVRRNVVVSLGGGAITFTPNLQFVREHGILIYLQVPAEILVERLYGKRERPLLRGDDGHLLDRKALHAKVDRMLADRTPFYEQAHLVVDAGEPLPEETVEAIIEGIDNG